MQRIKDNLKERGIRGMTKDKKNMTQTIQKMKNRVRQSQKPEVFFKHVREHLSDKKEGVNVYLQTLRSYSIFMVFVSIALTIVGFTQIFPYQVDIAGLSTSDLLNSIQEDEQTIKSLTESGNLVEYAVASGYIAWEGVKIIVSVLMFVLGGFAEILMLLGVESAIAVLLQAGIDFLVIFEFGQTIFNRG